MKPEVKKLVENFRATAKTVQQELKEKGFILPVAHNGGIKYYHLWVKKNSKFMYDIRNLHNPKLFYYHNICNHKLAIAIMIYEALGKDFNSKHILDLDDAYAHHLQNIKIYKYHSRLATKSGKIGRSDIIESRCDYHYNALEPLKIEVRSVLNEAEKLMFDNK